MSKNPLSIYEVTAAIGDTRIDTERVRARSKSEAAKRFKALYLPAYRKEISIISVRWKGIYRER